MQEESKQINTVPADISDEEGGIDEMLVGKGIGNALKVLRERGALGKNLVRGRNMDKTVESQLKTFDKGAEGS